MDKVIIKIILVANNFLAIWFLALIEVESVLRELLFFLELQKRPKEVLCNLRKKAIAIKPCSEEQDWLLKI